MSEKRRSLEVLCVLPTGWTLCKVQARGKPRYTWVRFFTGGIITGALTPLIGKAPDAVISLGRRCGKSFAQEVAGNCRNAPAGRRDIELPASTRPKVELRVVSRDGRLDD